MSKRVSDVEGVITNYRTELSGAINAVQINRFSNDRDERERNVMKVHLLKYLVLSNAQNKMNIFEGILQN